MSSQQSVSNDYLNESLMNCTDCLSINKGSDQSISDLEPKLIIYQEKLDQIEEMLENLQNSLSECNAKTTK